MNRTLICLAALVTMAGCQNPAWQNPYAMIGPATMPPPTPQPGEKSYYEPAVVKVKSPGNAVRSEITAQPRTNSPLRGPIEEPIRIVEAAPAAKTSSVKSSPPGVVATSSASRSGSVVAVDGAAPAVKFNPSTIPAELSQLPRPPKVATPETAAPAVLSPAVNRTRGYIPAQPATQPSAAPPKNRLSTPSVMPTSGPTSSQRHDDAVSPATFVETTTAATGQWKAR